MIFNSYEGLDGADDGHYTIRNKRSASPALSSNDKRKKNTGNQVVPLSEANESTKASGLRRTQHGIQYQISITTLLCLANIKKVEDKSLCFEIIPEDPKAGKFDDIVYGFKIGNTQGTFKIQVKHKLNPNATPIRETDFCSKRNTNNPFAIKKYFFSFCGQKHATVDNNRLIICTNSYIDENARDLWKPVNQSENFLDDHMLELFGRIEGKCYQLNYDKSSPLKQKLNDLLEDCFKCTSLAKLLVNEAILGNNVIDMHTSLYKEYHNAIMSIVEPAADNLYKFRYKLQSPVTSGKHNSSSTNLTANNHHFIEEFEKQYRRTFNRKGKEPFDVWKDLELKRIIVTKDFCFHTTGKFEPIFPIDQMDEGKIEAFCRQFRLVSGTQSNSNVKITVQNILDNWHSSKGLHGSFAKKDLIGEYTGAHFYQKIAHYVEDTSQTSITSDDIINALKTTDNKIDIFKMDTISKNLQKLKSEHKFRIDARILGKSELFKGVKENRLLMLITCNIQFGARTLLDILELLVTEPYLFLFLDASEFTLDPKSITSFFESNDTITCLIIGYHKACSKLYTSLDLLRKTLKNEGNKWILLINESKSSHHPPPHDSTIKRYEIPFYICNLSEESKQWFFAIDNFVSLCNTSIAFVKLFNESDEVLLEHVFKQIFHGNQKQQDNVVLKGYEKNKWAYNQRSWKIKTNKNQERSRTDEIQLSKISEIINKALRSYKCATAMVKHIKTHNEFNEIFEAINSSIKQDASPIVEEQNRKVNILLEEEKCRALITIEATRLAWYLRKQNRSSWIVKCSLFRCLPLIKRSINEQLKVDTAIEEDFQKNADLRTLYQLIRLSLIYDDNIFSYEAPFVLKCAGYITWTKNGVNLSPKLKQSKELSLEDQISLLVFKEKFNTGELVLLFHGFDDIEPCYLQQVLKLLSRFAQFHGIKKLFLISYTRTKEDVFNEAFIEPSFYELQPLSLKEKASILYKMLEIKIQKIRIDDKIKSDFFGVLSATIISSLQELSNNPLNFMKSLVIFEKLAADYMQNVNKCMKSDMNMELLKETRAKLKYNIKVESYNAPVNKKLRRSTF